MTEEISNSLQCLGQQVNSTEGPLDEARLLAALSNSFSQTRDQPFAHAYDAASYALACVSQALIVFEAKRLTILVLDALLPNGMGEGDQERVIEGISMLLLTSPPAASPMAHPWPLLGAAVEDRREIQNLLGSLRSEAFSQVLHKALVASDVLAADKRQQAACKRLWVVAKREH